MMDSSATLLTSALHALTTFPFFIREREGGREGGRKTETDTERERERDTADHGICPANSYIHITHMHITLDGIGCACLDNTSESCGLESV